MPSMKYSFTAIIEAGPGGGAFVIFPYDVEKEFGVKGRVPVKATFDGLAYSGSLTQCGGAQHMLGILKVIREQIGKQFGDTVLVEVWRDDGQRRVEVPADLADRMREHGVQDFFDSLSFTNRKEYCRWIADAKKQETRSARLAKSIDMMRRGIRTPG
ncbi:YdeI/OmpD-associated family protein [Telmatobacter sp. DSM 110680]|uniref:YdeI/OmpD-associated family protein n=1 Tax=Telmatobacter sp. DSM 110680 TaxID=3036704 RepID=A0AAU7DG64_9BACT